MGKCPQNLDFLPFGDGLGAWAEQPLGIGGANAWLPQKSGAFLRYQRLQ